MRGGNANTVAQANSICLGRQPTSAGRQSDANICKTGSNCAGKETCRDKSGRRPQVQLTKKLRRLAAEFDNPAELGEFTAESPNCFFSRSCQRNDCVCSFRGVLRQISLAPGRQKPWEGAREPRPFRAVNRSRRHVRRERSESCVGKSHFPGQKSQGGPEAQNPADSAVSPKAKFQGVDKINRLPER